jgi:hypothetical protein
MRPVRSRILCILHWISWLCGLRWLYMQFPDLWIWYSRHSDWYWDIPQSSLPIWWVRLGVIYVPRFLPSVGGTFDGRCWWIRLGLLLRRSIPPIHFSLPNAPQLVSGPDHIGLNTLSLPVVQSGWSPSVRPWIMHAVMRVVPRAYCQLVRYMLAWTLHQVRCLPCYFTRIVLDSPHERWRV